MKLFVVDNLLADCWEPPGPTRCQQPFSSFRPDAPIKKVRPVLLLMSTTLILISFWQPFSRLKMCGIILQNSLMTIFRLYQFGKSGCWQTCWQILAQVQKSIFDSRSGNTPYQNGGRHGYFSKSQKEKGQEVPWPSDVFEPRHPERNVQIPGPGNLPELFRRHRKASSPISCPEPLLNPAAQGRDASDGLRPAESKMLHHRILRKGGFKIMKDQQAKFLTPAETLIKLTAKITAAGASRDPISGSHYQAKCNYLKMRSLLRQALAGHLGPIREPMRIRIDKAMQQLDELYEKNRRILRRPPDKNCPELRLL